MIYRSWRKTQIALLLLAEERVGAPLRAETETSLAEEDAAFHKFKAQVR